MIVPWPMTPDAVFGLATEHLDDEAAVIATAISWAESGLRADAVGDENLQDSKWGPSIGLWQVRSLRSHLGTGQERDANRLKDPAFNAQSMATISKGGTDWSPWSVYRDGKYRKHLDAVRAAIKPGGTPMRLVTRAEWGARSPASATGAPGMTRGVGVHWLGPGAGRRDHGQCDAHMREVQAFHMGPARGWADFAYNAAACSHGYVFAGRGPKVRNAANGGGTRHGVDANAGWASVLYLAGTDGPGLTSGGKDAINDAAVWLGVAGGEWLGHRDFLSTECPGNEIYSWVHSGHPRGSQLPDPNPTQGDISMLTFRYIFNNEDWVFDGPSKLFFQLTDVRQITEVLDKIGIKALGRVSDVTHHRYREIAAAGGFTG